MCLCGTAAADLTKRGIGSCQCSWPISATGRAFLGRLPEFVLVSNMFDMFGKDFIGVGSDNPVFNDKSILARMDLGKI